MLSTKVVGNAAQAQHYFLGHDNYYTEENTLANERSEWWGKGACELGLTGTVNTERFTELLKGRLPDGEQLGLKVENEIKHRPGFDLTFSVPKSVSIVGLLGEDSRILGAIHRATDNTLGQIERACAQARTTKYGITQYENTKNLVVAKFLHDISREADPQLHVHCVVMNMTKRNDGRWRSLASQAGRYNGDVSGEINGFIERVRHDRNHYGAIFRAELAYELKQLGYTTTKTKNGLFEIEGVSQKTIDAYSKRAKQIETYMQEHGWSSSKAAAFATLQTRQSKKNISRENLQQQWQETSKSQGIDAFAEAKQCVELSLRQSASKQRPTPLYVDPIVTTLEGVEKPQPAINERDVNNTTLRQPSPEIHKPLQSVDPLVKATVCQALDSLAETKVAIKEIELINATLNQSLESDLNIQKVIAAIGSLQQSGEIIALQSPASETCYVTKKQLQYEQDVLKTMGHTAVGGKPLVAADKVKAYLSNSSELNTEQKHAVSTLLGASNTLSILEGPARSGKTFVAKTMMELAKLEGHHVIFLSPSKANSEDLKAQIKGTPTTLRAWFKQIFDTSHHLTFHQFTKNPENYLQRGFLAEKKNIIFVDNATQLATKQIHDLSQMAEKRGNHVVLMADQKTTLTWLAGSPVTQMIQHGALCAHLTQQHSVSQELRSAMRDSLQNNTALAFAKVEHRIFSIENKEERVAVMAAHYAHLPNAQRDKTFVLMPSNAQREEMNYAIRTALKLNQSLPTEGIDTTLLVPKSLQPTEYRQAKNYEKGQWVRFNESYASLHIKKGEYRQISDVHAKQNILVLEDSKGKIHFWDPAKVAGSIGKVEVFDAKNRELVIGETLTWRRNHPLLKLHNGERLTLAEIRGEKLILRRENQKKVSISLKEHASRHFDYGYAATPQQKYHDKAHTVIAYQNCHSRQSHQRAFYKTLSQATERAWIYTENKAALLKNVQTYSGDKSTVIETLIGEKITYTPNGQQTVSEHVQLLESVVAKNLTQLQTVTITEKAPETVASEAVAYALAHLSEREAAFKHKDVLVVALSHALGNANSELINNAVLQAEKEGELVRGIYSHDGTHWTTREAIEMEREILELASKYQGKIPPIVASDIIERHLQTIQPKEEHGFAIRTLASATDRIIVVQGYAGVGKTTLLKYVEPLLKGEEYELLTLAPTHPAVKQLKVRGLQAQTLDSFIGQNRAYLTASAEAPKAARKLIIAVDEASMISNRRMRDFLKIAEMMGAIGWLIGDREQYPSIEGGKPQTVLQKSGIPTVYLTDIERQKDDTLKKAVKEIYQKDFAGAFATLSQKMIEVGQETVENKKVDNRVTRLELMSKHYLSLTPFERTRTMMLTFGNEDRIEGNEIVRKGLAKEGTLHGNEISTIILAARDMTQVEKTRAINYNIGNYVRFSGAHAALQIEKNSYFSIASIDKERNSLVLKDDSGKSFVYPLPSHPSKHNLNLEVYREEGRELMAGDLIRWTRTQKDLGYFSPEILHVLAVAANNSVKLQPLRLGNDGWMAEGPAMDIQLKEHKQQHWDHAYFMTGYSAQGSSIHRIFLNAESYRKNLISQPAITVAVTRAIQDITIYTDDKAQLLKRIETNLGLKTSALETIGELPHSLPESKLARGMTTPTAANPTLHTPSPSAKNSSAKQNTFKNASSIKPKARIDMGLVDKILKENTEVVLERMLGEPKERSGSQLRYGSNKGSLVVTITGEKCGLWHDFQTGEGGNLLQLIARESGFNVKVKSDFPKIIEHAIKLVGVSEDAVKSYDFTGSKKPIIKASATPTLSGKQQKSVQHARRLARQSQSLAGTLAERYLREHRGIHLDKWPSSFRFHPAIRSGINDTVKPALLIVAKDEQNKVQAVQAIFLDEKTGNKANVNVKKQTWGLPSSGAMADIPSVQKGGPVYLAEGPETALSIRAAIPQANVKVTLGKSNFKHLDPKTAGAHVVLCLDNDGDKPKGEKLIIEAADKLLEHGKHIWIAKPNEIGKDYNDLLKEQGAEAIRSNIEKAVSYTQVKGQETLETALIPEVLGKNIMENRNAIALNFNKKIAIPNHPSIHSPTSNLYGSINTVLSNNAVSQRNNGRTISQIAESSTPNNSVKNQAHPSIAGRSKALDKSLDKEMEI
ncbi:hypothetical protein BH10PSE19_BH10PSE19_00020 [soil metagenome]